jgi:immune inhibitor A
VTDKLIMSGSSYMMTANIPSVPIGAKLSFYEWWDIEPYYDWGGVQVSADGGSTWTSLPGKHTTTADPIGGNPGNGLTGAGKKKMVLEEMDMSTYAGVTDLKLRFVLYQDEAVFGLGWTLDDIMVVGSDGTVAFQDLVDQESSSKWTVSASDDLGSGWTIAGSGVGGSFRHYYIMEWRNFVGFDSALSGCYQFVGAYVEHFSYNPGLAIWYRDMSVADNDYGMHPGQVAIGLVDAHPEPLYMANGYFVRERIQLMDATFGLRTTVPNTINLVGVDTEFSALPAATGFDDSNVFFHMQKLKGSYRFIGLELPSYGVHVEVLSEEAGLSGATISITASPP